MRVLVTGAGGELGLRVSTLLAADPRITDLAGMDLVRARRKVESTFWVVDPQDRHRVVPLVQRYQPDAIVHLGVYEPDARSSPAEARLRTSTGTLAVLGAAAEVGNLQRIVVRSGLEVYGRARHSPSVPDESVVPHPTSAFGRSLLEVERLAADTGRSAGVPVAVLRVAPVVGPGFPSPLGRFLRLPVVPYSALADPTFSVLHVDDAAAGLVAALFGDADEPVNVLGSGVVTVSQAARLGRRWPLPLLGPEWLAVRRLSGLIRTPLPGHLLELVHRGRTAEDHRCVELLGWAPARTTREVIDALYRWDEPPALHLVEAEAA